MTFTHDDVEERLIDFLYGELDAEARAAFDAHIGSCDRCRSEVRALEHTRSTARAVVRAPLAEAVPVQTQARVREAIARATAEKARTAAPAERVVPIASRWSAWWRARWTLPMFATVAAMGALLLVRETIFREARRPLGESPPSDVATRPEPAAAPVENLAPVGAAEQPARLPEEKSARAKRHRAPSDARAGKAAVSAAADPKRGENTPPAKARREMFDDLGNRQEEARARQAPAPAPPPKPAVSHGFSSDSAEGELEDRASASFRSSAKSTAPVAPQTAAAPPPLPAPPAAMAPPPPLAAEPSSAPSGGGASPSDPVAAQAERAETLMAAQRWNDAAAAYRDLLRRFPGHASAPVWRRKLAAAQDAAARDSSRFATPPPPR